MKRAELKIGDELYYAERRNWDNNHPADGPFGNGYRLGKATVLAVTPYSYDSWRPRGQEIEPASKGNGVLVEINGRRRVVQLTNLRGPYEKILAEVKERAARDQALAEIAANERELRASKINGVVRRLVETGAASAHRAGFDSGSITVRAEELAALLDQIDEAYARGVEAGREAGQDEAAPTYGWKS